jgi:hypothetical protein
MKTKNLLKLALMMVAMFTFVGVNAQILTDYENVAETVYQTEGKNFRIYVEPDLVYSPGYVAATNTGIGAAARWTWNLDGLTAVAPWTDNTTAFAQNYVEISAPAAGAYTIEVAESTTIGIGCPDATPETRDFVVIPVPTATITTADPAQACDDQPAAAVAMTFTEAVPAGLAGYAFNIEELVETIDPSDVVLSTIRTVTDFVEYTTAAKLNTVGALTGGASPYGFTFNTSALVVEGGNRTRYTYTLRKASDAPGAAADGLISAISEKSDYVGGTVLTHAFGAKTTFVAIVNPAPTTGPIFHIPNDFAY